MLRTDFPGISSTTRLSQTARNYSSLKGSTALVSEMRERYSASIDGRRFSKLAFTSSKGIARV